MPVSQLMSETKAVRAASSMPLRVVMTYHFVNFALFLLWPINWPIYYTQQWVFLVLYVLICFATLIGFFHVGARGAVPPARSPAPNLAIILGGAFALALLVPLSYTYTGDGPWAVINAIDQQGDIYREYQRQLVLTAGERGPVAIARALTWPFTFAVVPLGILHWRRLSYPFRTLVILTALCSITFSLLRGTDREFAEMFMVIGATLLVSLGRSANARASASAILRRIWKPALFMLVFLSVAASLFTDRKADRLGQTNTVCVNVSRICADLDAPAIAWLDDRAKFGASLFIISSASGYYGLALGMEKEFLPTFGVGHSAFSISLYEAITGDENVRTRTYTYRNQFDGWSPENYWSTAILWFANDVGFPGAVLVVALIAILWGRSWRDATTGNNDAAAVVFCLVMIGVIQIASTNAVLNALEGYLALGGWSAMWLRSRGLAPVTRRFPSGPPATQLP